jgi:AcrR family transcriptional regulator/acyl-CoA thioesterase FadM
VTQTAAEGPPRPDTRRATLIAAALRVIQRRGFASATVSDITREAGASVGLLNYYFASKDEVLAEAFADLARTDLAALEGIARRASPAPERLAAFLESSEWQDAESWRMWVDAWGDAVHTAAMRSTLEDFARGWRRALADVLADGDREGAWTCPEPEDAAARLVAALDGIGIHATLHPDDVPPERASAWARRLAELELGVTLPAAPAVAPAPEGRPVEIVLPTRARDLDATGRVHAAALLALLEQGRAAWLGARLASLAEPPELMVADMSFEVLRPVTRGEDSVVVRCALDRVRVGGVRTTETLRTAAGALAMTARTTLVPLDAADRPRPLTASEREAFGG